MANATAYGAPLPPAFDLATAKCQPLAPRRATIWFVFDLVGAMQVVAVGLLLLPFLPARFASPWGVARSFGLGLVAAALSAMIYHGMQPPPGGLTKPARSVRALQAAGAVGIAFSIVAACRFLAGEVGASPAPLLAWGTISAVIAASLQLLRWPETRVAIVGESGPAAVLAHSLSELAGPDRVQVVATLNARCPEDLARLDELVAVGSVQTVVAPSESDAGLLSTLCTRLADTPAHVVLATATSAVPLSPFAAVLPRAAGGVLLTDVLPPPMAGWRRGAKRAFDISVALMLLPTLAPLLILIAVAIRLESRGPVLFRQWRFGQGSRPVLI